MSDLISRQAVLDEMDKRHAEGDYITKGFIKALPSVENTGEWRLGGYDDMYYVCSKCSCKASEYYNKPKFNFCPNCGADMRGKADE